MIPVLILHSSPWVAASQCDDSPMWGFMGLSLADVIPPVVGCDPARAMGRGSLGSAPLQFRGPGSPQIRRSVTNISFIHLPLVPEHLRSSGRLYTAWHQEERKRVPAIVFTPVICAVKEDQ